MDKGTTNSGLPVFGEIIKLLDKQRINTLADKMKANRYTKRLDASASRHYAVCSAWAV